MYEWIAYEIFRVWKPIFGEILPPEWFWNVVDALGYLYLLINFVRDRTMSDIKEAFKQIVDLIAFNYLRLMVPAIKVREIEKTVTTTPEPLYTDELACHRIHVQNPPDNIYCIYIGDELYQKFVIRPGERFTLEVRDPRKVYVKSNGVVRVIALFEVANGL